MSDRKIRYESHFKSVLSVDLKDFGTFLFAAVLRVASGENWLVKRVGKEAPSHNQKGHKKHSHQYHLIILLFGSFTCRLPGKSDGTFPECDLD